MATESEMNFESAIARLEQIVRSLETGSAPLDESLTLFEEGVRLVKLCNDKLEHAESKIRLLTKQPDGTVGESDFPAAQNAGGAQG